MRRCPGSGKKDKKRDAGYAIALFVVGLGAGAADFAGAAKVESVLI
jgi:hypothetical protein